MASGACISNRILRVRIQFTRRSQAHARLPPILKPSLPSWSVPCPARRPLAVPLPCPSHSTLALPYSLHISLSENMQASFRYILAVVAVVATAFTVAQATPVPVSPFFQAKMSCREASASLALLAAHRNPNSNSPARMRSLLPLCRHPLSVARLGSLLPTGDW